MWQAVCLFLSSADEGQVYTFGSDYYGCLGRGEDYEPEDDDDEEEVKSPILVSFFNERPVNKISCGDNHILALTKDKQVYSWGCGEFGKSCFYVSLHVLYFYKP